MDLLVSLVLSASVTCHARDLVLHPSFTLSAIQVTDEVAMKFLRTGTVLVYGVRVISKLLEIRGSNRPMLAMSESSADFENIS